MEWFQGHATKELTQLPIVGNAILDAPTKRECGHLRIPLTEVNLLCQVQNMHARGGPDSHRQFSQGQPGRKGGSTSGFQPCHMAAPPQHLNLQDSDCDAADSSSVVAWPVLSPKSRALQSLCIFRKESAATVGAKRELRMRASDLESLTPACTGMTWPSRPPKGARLDSTLLRYTNTQPQLSSKAHLDMALGSKPRPSFLNCWRVCEPSSAYHSR